MKKRGKIIVIDGVDGCGKKTQTKILVERLKKLKHKAVCIDFPQYEKNFFGKFLKEVLRGEEYSFLKVHPKIASVLYAADRWETRDKINKYLNEGYFVILDRYVSSNQIHQGAKLVGLPNEKAVRKDFLEFLNELEYKVFKLPRPDIILYLNLKLQTIANLLKERDGGDVAEKDLKHQKDSIESAKRLCDELKNMKMINCDDDDWGIKSREDISDLIFNQVKRYL